MTYRAAPLTLAVASTFVISKVKAASTEQPLQFVPSGEPIRDSQELEHIRADWKQRNHGIGLRDVSNFCRSRSGGGV
ncbi:hypothetical protein EC973_006677 [Apophysomyces ossiformis]|uniref:Secreted protein n=1 Tax=Apophysomyces ossiformis TaxID=679940 RepID=A0A8H7BQQ0_9FUNG|nr:hypothetical protein EC973_006677 [Apophysomyces ossiformis]